MNLRPRPRNPRKIITRVIVFLLLGAIVNVAVAWAISILNEQIAGTGWPMQIGCDLPAENASAHSKPYLLWSMMVETKPAAIRAESFWISGKEIPAVLADCPEGVGQPEPLVPGWADFLEPAANSEPTSTMHIRVVEGWGWPCRSLYAKWVADADLAGDLPVIKRIGGFQVSASPRRRTAYWLQSEGRVVPLLPIWRAMAINTIFYAAILALLLVAPGSVRRTIRRRRGLCPACAYPVGTSPVCTECGKPVTARVAHGT